MSNAPAPKELRAYLAGVREVVHAVVGSELAGLYLFGSWASGDGTRRSDIDLLCVSNDALGRAQKEELAQRLEHKRWPCPAAGLDFSVYRLDVVRDPPFLPPYEVAIATGEAWPTEVAYGGYERSVLLDLAVCRSSGQVLYGPPTGELFGLVPRPWLLAALRELILWHRAHLYDPFHDPLGHQAVLNACRAWCYSATGRLVAKTAGGMWVLACHPEHLIVRHALARRRAMATTRLEQGAIQAFLEAVLSQIEG